MRNNPFGLLVRLLEEFYLVQIDSYESRSEGEFYVAHLTEESDAELVINTLRKEQHRFKVLDEMRIQVYEH